MKVKRLAVREVRGKNVTYEMEGKTASPWSCPNHNPGTTTRETGEQREQTHSGKYNIQDREMGEHAQTKRRTGNNYIPAAAAAAIDTGDKQYRW
jgi:hypothetical protein